MQLLKNLYNEFIVNGTTTGYFVKKAGLASTSQVKQRVFISFLQNFLKEIDNKIKGLKGIPFLNYLQEEDWYLIQYI